MHRAIGFNIKNLARYYSYPHEKPIKLLGNRAILTAAINDNTAKVFRDGRNGIHFYRHGGQYR